MRFSSLLIIFFLANCGGSSGPKTKSVPKSPYQLCLNQMDRHKRICSLSYGMNYKAAKNCKVWRNFNNQRCAAIYNNSKPISEKISRCIHKAKSDRSTCRLVNNQSQYEMQKCNEYSFDQQDFCFKL